MDEKFYFETDVMSEDEILKVFIPDKSLGENVGRSIPIITKSVFIECYNKWIKEPEEKEKISKNPFSAFGSII